jgi:hypothetical protein
MSLIKLNITETERRGEKRKGMRKNEKRLNINKENGI